MTPAALIERATAALEARPWALAAWLAGSFGRGTADAYSDVDLLVAVEGGARERIAAEWEALLDAISPTVFRRYSPPFLINAITPEWLRFDLLLVTPDALPLRPREEHRPLFDRAGLDAHLGERPLPARPSAARVEFLAQEFLRVLGLAPVALGRGELLVAATGVGLLRGLLIDLIRIEVGAEGGALRLDPLLSEDLRAELLALPAAFAERGSVIEAQVAIARAFLPRARALCAKLGVAWPEEFERATARHLRERLGIELPGGRPGG